MKLWNFIKMVFSLLFFAFVISSGTMFVGEEVSGSTLLITAVYWLLFKVLPRLLFWEDSLNSILATILIILLFVIFKFPLKDLIVESFYEIYMIFSALLFFVVYCKIMTKYERVDKFWYPNLDCV